jgi:carboxyl-terminal processing protease
MRSAATFLLLLFIGPGWGYGWAPAFAQAPRAQNAFDLSLAASVFTAALAFIAPRTLEPVSVQQLALWGLSAPGSIDNALATELRDGTVVLLQGGKLIYTRPVPADDAPESWGVLIADVLDAAAKASPSFAAAGTRGAISGVFDSMFDHLDPYSRYVGPGDADTDRANRDGEAGLGISIARFGHDVIVTDVNADGPGGEAGIRVGDRVIDIDGDPAADEDLETLQGWLGGLEGTDVTITVRSRTGRPRTLEITRAVIPPESVFASQAGDILVLRITRFSVDTDHRMQRELEQGLAPATLTRHPVRGPVRGIVIDLRGNRGGRLNTAVAATELVLGKGVIATTAGRNPMAAHTWSADVGDKAGDRPIVVLVDGRTASAAEVMAAALSDQGRAVVVGSATLGKGLVQAVKSDLPDDGELFVSWSRLFAPDGWPLQGLGVLPQVCTSLGQEALSQQLEALNHGEQPMATELARHNAARAPLPTAQALALRTACPAAEGRDADMAAAKFLISHPAAYQAARLVPPQPAPAQIARP